VKEKAPITTPIATGAEIRATEAAQTLMAKQKLPDDIKAFFVEMGARGGRIGGKRRMETMTPERRKEIAHKAITARWARARTRADQ
jgi:hypothetical protein